MNLSPSKTAAARLFFLLLVPSMPAQESAKIPIRLVPRPNEAFKFEAAQEMEMDVTVEGMAQPAGAAPMKLLTKTVIAFTEKTREAKDPGKVDADITYDRITTEKTLNGKAMPGDNLGVELVGKTITFTYDKDGRISDVRVPEGISLNGDDLKQMMNSLYGSLPSAPMAVGETAATPFSMPLPIPTPGTDPLNITGQTRYTLTAVENEAGDRIARLDQTVTAELVTAVDIPLPKGSAKMDIRFKVGGSGDLHLNLARGIMKASRMKMSIEGDMVMTSDAPDMPPQSLKMRGTSQMASTGTY